MAGIKEGGRALVFMGVCAEPGGFTLKILSSAFVTGSLIKWMRQSPFGSGGVPTSFPSFIWNSDRNQTGKSLGLKCEFFFSRLKSHLKLIWYPSTYGTTLNLPRS